MKTEDILSELGFGPAELERKAQQAEARQQKRWGASGVEMMNVPMLTPPFDPDDPKELERTRRELYAETVKFYGDARVALKFLGPLDGSKETKTHTCEVCGSTFKARQGGNRFCKSSCAQKAGRKRRKRAA
jgi:hypothetical protein